MCCDRTMSLYFFCNDTATTEIYTLSLHDALPICWRSPAVSRCPRCGSSSRRCAPTRSRTGSTPGSSPTRCCRPTTGRSEEHTSELQSRQYLVCRLLLEKKKNMLPISTLHLHAHQH